MTTAETILLVILVLVALGIALLLRLCYRGGSNLIELEDELWPECECCGWVNKHRNYLEDECRKAQIEPDGTFQTSDKNGVKRRWAIVEEPTKTEKHEC